jgi:hypothetical protein
VKFLKLFHPRFFYVKKIVYIYTIIKTKHQMKNQKGPHLKPHYSKQILAARESWLIIEDTVPKRSGMDAIRHWTEYVEIMEKPLLVSTEAAKVALSKGIDPENLKTTSYNKQTKSIKNGGLGDKGKVNGLFHYEHLVPVSYIWESIVAMENPTLQEIESFIDNIAQGAWLTKEESKRLDKINKSNIRIENDLILAEINWI